MWNNNNCSCVWLILIIILILFGCGCGCSNNCGCNNNCVVTAIPTTPAPAAEAKTSCEDGTRKRPFSLPKHRTALFPIDEGSL